MFLHSEAKWLRKHKSYKKPPPIRLVNIVCCSDCRSLEAWPIHITRNTCDQCCYVIKSDADGGQTQLILLFRLLYCCKTTFHLFIDQTATHADTVFPHDCLSEPFLFLIDSGKYNNFPSVPLCLFFSSIYYYFSFLYIYIYFVSTSWSRKYFSKHVVH